MILDTQKEYYNNTGNRKLCKDKTVSKTEKHSLLETGEQGMMVELQRRKQMLADSAVISADEICLMEESPFRLLFQVRNFV